ncbi:hypothetical protein G5C51_12835 [Streptomyces sp. A7024]|uniref:Uncharacterized protein n=1 Tax=Streptomyces coryli TaxID=1128680 RepID=A0A6G4TY86_9ACTN|nr:hypothetical protein [Streptomyces coryli]NGN64783.1 hypothetical protein [Streptomyces coryli]
MAHDPLLQPECWLLFALAWPEATRAATGTWAVALVPAVVPRRIVSRGAGVALDLAQAAARAPGSSRAVFLSDITLWLNSEGKTWSDLGIDHHAVTHELARARVPLLRLTLTRTTYALMCDAGRGGRRQRHPGGRTRRVTANNATARQRRQAHTHLARLLAAHWPTYIQDVIDRGMLRAA